MRPQQIQYLMQRFALTESQAQAIAALIWVVGQ